MIDKIREIYPEQISQSFNSSVLYISDYTNRTNSLRTVECVNIKPIDITSFILTNNKSNINILYYPFKNNTFINSQTLKSEKHCECLLFPKEFTNSSWILFIEIKDCKYKNISKYKTIMKQQLFDTIRYYREKNIISNNRIVNAIASFPNKEISPFDSFFYTQEEIIEIKDMFKIIFRGTNEVTIIDSDRIKV